MAKKPPKKIYLKGRIVDAELLEQWSVFAEMIGATELLPNKKTVKLRMSYWKKRHRKAGLSTYKELTKQMKHRKTQIS